MKVKCFYKFYILLYFISISYSYVQAQGIISIAKPVFSLVNQQLGLIQDRTAGLQEKLDRIEKIQLIEIKGEISGVIKTIEEASNFTDIKRKYTIYQESILHINKAIEKNLGLVNLYINEDYKITFTGILTFKNNTKYAKGLILLNLISSYQQLSILKFNILNEINETDIAKKYSELYLSNIKNIRKNIGKVVISFQQHLDTSMDGNTGWLDTNGIPYFIYDFCNDEISTKYFIPGVKIFSKNLPSLNKEELRLYADLLCLSTVIDVKKSDKSLYTGGPYPSQSDIDEELAYFEIFEIDNLVSYPINHAEFSKSYGAYIEKMQRLFPEILEVRSKLPKNRIW